TDCAFAGQVASTTKRTTRSGAVFLIFINFFDFTQVLNKLLIVGNSFIDFQSLVHYMQRLVELKLVHQSIRFGFHAFGVIGRLHLILLIRLVLVLILIPILQPTAEQLIIVAGIFILRIF